jgi:hypothetical protein
MSDFNSLPDSGKIREFTGQILEYPENKLREIIVRYIDYQPEMVEAALKVSNERGLITYDLKQKLSAQTQRNFEAHSKGIRQSSWQQDNAFRGYVSGYSDDEIYGFIENPSDIVIDVYFALLDTAKDRGLISDHDFLSYRDNAIMVTRSDKEIMLDDYIESTRDLTYPGEDMSPDEAEEARLKSRICPSCNELVDASLTICPYCRAEIPEIADKPSRQDFMRYQELKRPFNFTRGGISILICGIVLLFLGFVNRPAWHIFRFRWDAVIIGAAGVIAGLIFLIKGALKK